MIPFAPWLPDLAPFNNTVSADVTNVIPSASGFRPVPGLVTTTTALTARAQGGVSVRGLSGTIANFCGDATKLYKLSSDGLTWNDVSRVVGGAYATALDGWWDFTLFGDRLIATNGIDVPQTFQLDVSANFVLLGGTPPTASFTGVVRDFVVLARRNTAYNRITWSAINNSQDYVASATTLSDAQDFPEGGAIMGFVGGEYGLVFLEKGIFRMAFEGPPTVFRFDRISNVLGCRAERSIAAYENLAFFLSDDGFYMIRGGSEIVPIGTEKIDRTAETLIDGSYLYRVSSAIDPIKKLYCVGFASPAGSGTPDMMMVYHWPTGEWGKWAVNHEIIYSAATQAGYNVDTVDVLGNVDTMPYSPDSRLLTGSGRLLLSGFDTTHKSGFFSGANLAATIETGDTQLTQGKKSLLRSLRTMIEGSAITPTVTIRSRNNLDDSYTDATGVPVNSIGTHPVRVNARYHRAKVTIPAASSWTFAQGIDDVVFSETGGR